jgi:hypothetical protein
LKRDREAFILIITIGLLVIFSTLTAMIVSLSSETYSSTGKSYQYNQAKLMGRSSLEIAILMIEDRTSSDRCLQNLNIIDGDFNASLEINYIGKYQNCNQAPIFTAVADETNGTVIIDVYVRVKGSNETLFHRRTAQKP